MVATLALAIGANASVFSVTQALLLRTLPYDAPERIVRIRGGDLDPGGEIHPMLDAFARFRPDGGANLGFPQVGVSRRAATPRRA